jgi:hypothetical protein
MKGFVFILFMAAFGVVFSQPNKDYRFSFNMSFMSMMHWNLKDLKNVPGAEGEYYKVYETEEFDLNYEDYNFSKGLNVGLSCIIFNKFQSYFRVSCDVFNEKYKESMTYTLTNIGDGTLIDNGIYSAKYSPEEVPLGYTEEVIFNDHDVISYGGSLSMHYFRRLRYGFKLGLGAFWLVYNRYDRYTVQNELEAFRPFISTKGRSYYSSKKLGASLELKKSFGRFQSFVNVGQTFLTTKKEENKGADEYRYYQSKAPLSQNLDFRFPLIIKIGVSVSFGNLPIEFRVISVPDF